MEAKGRPVLIGVYDLAEKGKICISSVHLTSGNNTNTRNEQILFMYTQSLERASDAIVMGDWNANHSDDQKSLEQLNFVDAWVVLKKKHGFTRHFGNDIHLDPNNPVKNWRNLEGHRLDRIGICSSKWHVSKISKIGTQNLWDNSKEYGLFISDHFGLVATLQYKK